MLSRRLTLALTVITALLVSSCSVSRKAVSEHSELKIESSETVERVLARASEQVRADSVIVEQRDTLREITTITIDRNDKGDTLKVVQITDLTRARSRDNVAAQRVKTEVRVDTVYVEKRDSVFVQENPRIIAAPYQGALNLTYVKWITALICAIVVLIITVKVCSLRR